MPPITAPSSLPATPGAGARRSSPVPSMAFLSCSGLGTVTIPASVTNLGGLVFGACPALTGVYFRGAAPTAGRLAFDEDTNVIALLIGPAYHRQPNIWVGTSAGRMSPEHPTAVVPFLLSCLPQPFFPSRPQGSTGFSWTRPSGGTVPLSTPSAPLRRTWFPNSYLLSSNSFSSPPTGRLF